MLQVTASSSFTTICRRKRARGLGRRTSDRCGSAPFNGRNASQLPSMRLCCGSATIHPSAAPKMPESATSPLSRFTRESRTRQFSFSMCSHIKDSEKDHQARQLEARQRQTRQSNAQWWDGCQGRATTCRWRTTACQSRRGAATRRRSPFSGESVYAYCDSHSPHADPNLRCELGSRCACGSEAAPGRGAERSRQCLC
jgi:hypothetical protein